MPSYDCSVKRNMEVLCIICYSKQALLGKGNYGKVLLASCNGTGERAAVKLIKRKHVRKEALPRLQREAAIMQKIQHKSIVRLLDHYEDKKEIILVLW